MESVVYSKQVELEEARNKKMEETAQNIVAEIWECIVSRVMDSVLEFYLDVEVFAGRVRLKISIEEEKIIITEALSKLFARLFRRKKKEKVLTKEDHMSSVAEIFNSFEGGLVQQVKLLEKVCEILEKEEKVRSATLNDTVLRIYT